MNSCRWIHALRLQRKKSSLLSKPQSTVCFVPCPCWPHHTIILSTAGLSPEYWKANKTFEPSFAGFRRRWVTRVESQEKLSVSTMVSLDVTGLMMLTCSAIIRLVARFGCVCVCAHQISAEDGRLSYTWKTVQRRKGKRPASRPLKVQRVTRAICRLHHSGKSLRAEACMAFTFPIVTLLMIPKRDCCLVDCRDR